MPSIHLCVGRYRRGIHIPCRLWCLQWNSDSNPFGGLPPYAYDWSPAPANGQGTSNPLGLCEGEWTVTVTDGLGNTAQATGTVIATSQLNFPNPIEMLSDCQNSCSGWVAIDASAFGGTPPYSYDFPFPHVNGSQVIFMGICGSFSGTTITATDANGCAVTFPVMVSNSTGGWPDIDYILPECGGSSNGVVALLDNYLSGAWYKVSNATFDSIHEFAAPPYIITGPPAGTYDIVLWDPNNPFVFGGGPVYCTFETAVTVASIAPSCGSVSGTVYNDVDQDCVLDPTDYPLPYRVMTIEPGPVYAISDANGEFIAALPQGRYTLTQPLVEEAQLCPVAHPVPFTLSSTTPDVIVDLADSSLVLHDLTVGIWTSNARSGFPTSAYVVLTNTSAYPSGDVTLTLSFPGTLQSPSPASGQWNFPSIPSFSSGVHTFTALIPADIALLGTYLNYTATAMNSLGEGNTANNMASTTVVITGSYDPNDKVGRTRNGDLDFVYFVDLDEWINYTIRFQNTGTAAAETVVIRDTIESDPDITSLQVLGATHNFTPSFDASRTLIFTFSEINLPDSTTDFAASQGAVHFRLKPRSGITFGDVLENTAGIYFDFNQPIITNTTEHSVEMSTGIPEHAQTQLMVLPNPAKAVRWSG